MAGALLIEAAELEERLAPLVSIGRDEGSTTRLAWTAEDAAAGRWFAGQAESLALAWERDPGGNLWAIPRSPPPWWAVGSHLDTVCEGGSYDGALGVAAAFAIAARSSMPLAVISFADEEGARFNTPTFGSRALAGLLDPAVLLRCDDTGTSLGEALARAGLDPRTVGNAAAGMTRLRGFLELHIDQTRQLAERGHAAGVVSALAARRRLRVHLTGRADHAGTTRGPDRRDALAAAARLVVRAMDLAAARAGAVATAPRILVEPNAFTTVPREVTLWIDLRAPDDEVVGELHDEIAQLCRSSSNWTNVIVQLYEEARANAVILDAALRRCLRVAADGLGMPIEEDVSFAGHDAGIVQTRRPAAMVLVRNATGVSHAPEESVDLVDAAAGASMILAALDALA